MDQTFFLKQLDDIIKEYQEIKERSKYDDLSGEELIEDMAMVVSRSKAATARIAGESSNYYKDVQSIIDQRFYPGRQVKLVIGCVMALRSDLQSDYLKSFSDIIKSEVFSDYLEMSQHILKEGYKDPAAVLIGTTLEVHLRELCLRNAIDLESKNSKGVLIDKKADTMNADLAKAGVYPSSRQKQVVAWLGLRNAAAHGKYNEYTVEEVKLMLQGVRDFILATTV